ncbi:MAG: J domain-containing protein [Deltaproteobacteria bacterium]|nr:J domain-containing protein [Deltaproteobacteria bacterium]
MEIKEAIRILELSELNSVEELKSQFYARAHELHPDKSDDPQANERFQELIAAYRVCLTNLSELFSHFDQVPSAVEEESVSAVIENLDDIFEDIFGFAKTGRVLGYREPQLVALTVEELCQGVSKEQKLTGYRSCPDCQGAGVPLGHSTKICTYCFGKGFTQKKNEQNARPKICQRCQGRGRMMSHACERCAGFGRLKEHKKYKINIPDFWVPGQVYTASGWDTKTQKPSELFLEIAVKDHPVFEIANHDLLCEYQHDFERHPEGRDVRVQTPMGIALFSIKANAKPKSIVRVAGLGRYTGKDHKARGDLVIVLKQRKHPWWQKVFKVLRRTNP